VLLENNSLLPTALSPAATARSRRSAGAGESDVMTADVLALALAATPATGDLVRERGALWHRTGVMMDEVGSCAITDEVGVASSPLPLPSCESAVGPDCCEFTANGSTSAELTGCSASIAIAPIDCKTQTKNGQYIKSLASWIKKM